MKKMLSPRPLQAFVRRVRFARGSFISLWYVAFRRPIIQSAIPLAKVE